jgi:hypothetical protein
MKFKEPRWNASVEMNSRQTDDIILTDHEYVIVHVMVKYDKHAYTYNDW